MCWKYEDEYGECFDMMEEWSRDLTPECVLIDFLKRFNIKVNNEWELIDRFWKILSDMHKKKIIEPLERRTK